MMSRYRSSWSSCARCPRRASAPLTSRVQVIAITTKYTVTATATTGLARNSPSATASATAALETRETDPPTTPEVTWSTEVRMVLSVSDVLRSRRMSWGARA